MVAFSGAEPLPRPQGSEGSGGRGGGMVDLGASVRVLPVRFCE